MYGLSSATYVLVLVQGGWLLGYHLCDIHLLFLLSLFGLLLSSWLDILSIFSNLFISLSLVENRIISLGLHHSIISRESISLI